MQHNSVPEGGETGVTDVSEQECVFNQGLLNEFQLHSERLRVRAREKRQAVTLKSAVLDREERAEGNADEMLGRRQPHDEYRGDVNMRTLQALLKKVDEAGFERSPHQMRFHSAFERATARVLYRDVRQPPIHPHLFCTDVLVCLQDWGTQRPAIMRKNNWDTCPSEVLIR